jgi:phosphoglycolate phosphatase
MTDFSENKKALLHLPKPKAVIFDWDNTLVDTWPLIQSAIDQTMQAMNREVWGLEKVRNKVHKSMRESFPEIFGDDWQKAGEIYKNAYRAIHLEKISFLPGALKLIKKLREKEILLFIISNKIGVTLRKEAAKLAVERDFFAIIGSHDTPYDKPSKEPVELALLGSGLNSQKDEIWFIGDTISDVQCAYNSGCRAIVYGNSLHQISKTITPQILAQKENDILPVYFDHEKLGSLL